MQMQPPVEHNSAELWAAVAAGASAIAALGTFWWQRRTSLDSGRPELILEDYWFSSTDPRFTLHASTLRNVGSGMAHSIYVVVPGEGDNWMTVVGTADHVPILAPQSTAKFNLIVEDDRTLAGDALVLRMRVNIVCFDRFGNRHETRLTFLRSKMPIGLTQPITNELYFSDRSVVVTPRWRLRAARMIGRLRERCQSVVSRLPLLRRRASSDDDAASD